MIKIFLQTLMLVPALASASVLESEVAADIQALVWDTVNEGAQTAKVIYKKKKPVVECKISNAKNDPVKKWAFCRVDFRVTFLDIDDVAERQCKLLYSFDPADVAKTLERASEDLIQDCMETLSEGP